MMISPNLSTKTYALVLVIISVIVVSGVQTVDGFSASGARIIFDVQLGETAVHEWALQNVLDEAIGIEVYVAGAGSELLTFEKLHILEPGEIVIPEIFVTIPKDHADNIAYMVELYALKRGADLEPGTSGIVINSQLKSFIEINIGDNPIYTPPALPINAEVPPEPIIKTAPKVEEGEEPAPIIEETLQEKLKRINDANKLLETTPQVTATDKPEVTDEGYTPEPIMDKEPVTQVALPTCGIWEMILSWFGIKSDCI